MGIWEREVKGLVAELTFLHLSEGLEMISQICRSYVASRLGMYPEEHKKPWRP